MREFLNTKWIMRNHLLVLVLVNIFFSILRGWDKELGVDDGHSLLESIGQIALQPIPEFQLSDRIQSTTIWNQNNLSYVIKSTNLDNGNMLFFQILLHYFIKLTNRTPLFLCLISISSYITTICLIYYLTLIMFGKRAAIISGLLSTTHIALIERSIAIRSYSLAITLSLAASIYFWQIAQKKNDEAISPRPYIFYVCFSVLSFYSHFLTAFILLSHVIFAIIFIRSKRIWISLSLCGLVFVLIFVAWGTKLDGFDAMKTHDIISRCVSYVEKTMGINMFGKYSFRTFVVTLVNIVVSNIGFGYLILSSKPIVRILTLIPILFTFTYYFLSSTNMKPFRNQKDGKIFLITLLLTPLLIQVLRTLQYKSLYHLQPVYQVFQIPYIIIITSHVIDVVYLKHFRFQRSCLQYKHLGLLFWVLFIIVVFTLQLIETNPLVNSNSYFSLATDLKDKPSSLKQVNSLYDAQLISFYAGRDSGITFVLSSQPKLDAKIKYFLNSNDFYCSMNYYMLYMLIAK